MPTKGSFWPLVVMVVIIVVAAGASAAVVAYLNPTHHPAQPTTVQYGDNVTVRYIGSFPTGAQAGRVFDTNIYLVAKNNLTYPKSLWYPYTHTQWAPSNFSWLPVHVGGNVPSSGYVLDNYTFIGVVPGFWQGILGMTVNSSRSIVMNMSEAYGPANPACYATQPMVFHVPVYVSVPRSTFVSAYPNVNLTTATTFVDPTYGWNDYLLSVNGSWVSFENLPAQGQATSPYGLPYYVSAISGGNLTITSRLTQGDAGKVLGTLPSGQKVCSASHFIVSTVNWANQTFTWNFNNEVEGQGLQFYVTVTKIFPQGS